MAVSVPLTLSTDTPSSRPPARQPATDRTACLMARSRKYLVDAEHRRSSLVRRFPSYWRTVRWPFTVVLVSWCVTVPAPVQV